MTADARTVARRERSARHEAAIMLGPLHRRRHRRHSGWQVFSEAADDAAEHAALHLAGHLAGGERDPYNNSLECAYGAALAAELLRNRSERIRNGLLDRNLNTPA